MIKYNSNKENFMILKKEREVFYKLIRGFTLENAVNNLYTCYTAIFKITIHSFFLQLLSISNAMIT